MINTLFAITSTAENRLITICCVRSDRLMQNCYVVFVNSQVIVEKYQIDFWQRSIFRKPSLYLLSWITKLHSRCSLTTRSKLLVLRYISKRRLFAPVRKERHRQLNYLLGKMSPKYQTFLLENSILKTRLTYIQNCYMVFVHSLAKKGTSAESRRYSYYLESLSFIRVVAW